MTQTTMPWVMPWKEIVDRAQRNVQTPVSPLNQTAGLVNVISEIVLSLEAELEKLRAASEPRA